MFLDLEKKKITEYKIEIMKNNFKHQKNVSNEQFYGQF